MTDVELAFLIHGKAPESRILDYKESIGQDKGDQQPNEMVKDVTAFANTGGGRLIIGVSESGGLPIDVPGVGDAFDVDQFKETLNNRLKNLCEPAIYSVEAEIVRYEEKNVLVIEVPRSYAAPHAVRHKSSFVFYQRTSSGVFPMDVTDLRRAFAFSEGVEERMQAFRQDRIDSVYDGRITLEAKGPMLMIHVLPLDTFGGAPTMDLRAVRQLGVPFPILCSAPTKTCYFDFRGLLICEDRQHPYRWAWTRIFRNGSIEGATPLQNHQEAFAMVDIEVMISAYVTEAVAFLQQVGRSTTCAVGITLVNMTGTKGRLGNFPRREIDFFERTLITEFAWLEGVPSSAFEARRLLSQPVDMIYQSAGEEGSPFLDLIPGLCSDYMRIRPQV